MAKSTKAPKPPPEVDAEEVCERALEGVASVARTGPSRRDGRASAEAREHRMDRLAHPSSAPGLSLAARGGSSKREPPSPPGPATEEQVQARKVAKVVAPKNPNAGHSSEPGRKGPQGWLV